MSFSPSHSPVSPLFYGTHLQLLCTVIKTLYRHPNPRNRSHRRAEPLRQHPDDKLHWPLQVLREKGRCASVRNHPITVKPHPSFLSPLHILTPTRDDVRELMSLISTLRGFPSNESKDVYGVDTKLDFATFEIQWSNQEDDPAAAGGELDGEQKDEFKRVVDSIEALARQFAKQDSAV
jgi:hypothetical protein